MLKGRRQSAGPGPEEVSEGIREVFAPTHAEPLRLRAVRLKGWFAVG